MGDLTNILREARASEPFQKLQSDIAVILAGEAAIPEIPVAVTPDDLSGLALQSRLFLVNVELVLQKHLRKAAANGASSQIAEDDVYGEIARHINDIDKAISNAIRRAAQELADEPYDGCKRGPFYKHRSV